MGTVILADVTELETIKISELTEAVSMTDVDVAPIVQTDTTKKITRPNAFKDMAIDAGEF